MPVFRRLEAHDPKHGPVSDLCGNLGYGSDGKGTPRSKYFLSSKVAVFRKTFLEADADIELFPLEYWSTAAQRCASNFLNQNIHLFQDSGEARVFHYPIYPQDKERLLEGLAKLICTQEYVRRRNANSAESAREKVFHYPGYPALLIRAKRAQEEKETLSVSVAAENGTGKKRSIMQTGPVYDMPFYDISTGPAAKRPRGNLFEGPFASSRNGSEEDHNFDTENGPETISVGGEGTREARRAPVAFMVTPLADRPQRSATAVQVELEQICNIPKQLSPAVMNSSSMAQAPASLQSDATLDEIEDTPPMLEKRTSPYALFGSSLNLPFDADTALIKSTPKLAAEKPSKKPELHYILPSFNGGLGHDNALRRETWWACNMSQFFNVVASRAGRPQGSFSCLTLTYNWDVESLVVHRFEGDQYWEEIKQRVKAKFLKARKSIKKKTTRFELWVECGDTTNLDDVQDDDDC